MNKEKEQNTHAWTFLLAGRSGKAQKIRINGNLHDVTVSHSVRQNGKFNFPFFSFFLSFFFFCFLGPNLHHMEVPRLGVELELQLLAYSTGQFWTASATYTTAHSNAGYLLNPLSKHKDWTSTFTDTSQVRNLLSHNRTSLVLFSKHRNEHVNDSEVHTFPVLLSNSFILCIIKHHLLAIILPKVITFAEILKTAYLLLLCK